jgi:hypothetical protein
MGGGLGTGGENQGGGKIGGGTNAEETWYPGGTDSKLQMTKYCTIWWFLFYFKRTPRL